jgi:hypothetical protein
MPTPLSRLGAPLALAAACFLAVACDRDAKPSSDTVARPPGYVVDSALPIDTLLARFRATVTDSPSNFVGGEASAERLAREFLRAISSNDTATVRRLVVNRAEFAWLYYPHTKFTKPPYELGPDLLWLQMNEASEKGIVRVLRRYGGSSMRFEALNCPDSVSVEGPNRITIGCRLRFAASDSAARTLQLFGSLMERDGRWKFVSYANEL